MKRRVWVPLGSFLVLGIVRAAGWIGRPPAGPAPGLAAAADRDGPAGPGGPAGADGPAVAVDAPAAAGMELLERLRDKDSRGPTLEQALADPGLAAWVLARLEQADFPASRVRELGWLLRAVLTVWQDLEPPPPFARRGYLERVVAAAARGDRAGSAAAFAWRGQRLLGPTNLDLVHGARPDRIDGLQAGQTGAGRASAYLAMLEDTLRSHLDLEQDAVVLSYLEDPSARVRMLARRLWFALERSGGWIAALEGLGALADAERLDLLRQIAQQAELGQAVAALRLAEQRFGLHQSFLGAWADLGQRDPRAVAGVYAELLEAGQLARLPEGDYLADPAADPGGYQEMQDVFHEARTRASLVTAYLVTAEHQGGVDWELIESAAWREWNPVVRGTAWTALAGSGLAEPVASAYQQLLDPAWRASARIPGVESDSHLAPGLAQLAEALPDGTLRGYRELLSSFRLSADERAGLEAILTRRAGGDGDM